MADLPVGAPLQLQQVLHQLARLEAQIANNGHKKWLSVEEAAAYLGFTPKALYAWVEKRAIPHTRKGRRVWFHKDWLDRWLEAGRVTTVREIIGADPYPHSRRKGRSCPLS